MGNARQYFHKYIIDPKRPAESDRNVSRVEVECAAIYPGLFNRFQDGALEPGWHPPGSARQIGHRLR
jgi:hypothetical protein